MGIPIFLFTEAANSSEEEHFIRFSVRTILNRRKASDAELRQRRFAKTAYVLISYRERTETKLCLSLNFRGGTISLLLITSYIPRLLFVLKALDFEANDDTPDSWPKIHNKSTRTL